MATKYPVPDDMSWAELRAKSRYLAREERAARKVPEYRDAAATLRGLRAAIDRRIAELEARDRQLVPALAPMPQRLLGDRAMATVLSLWVLGCVAIASAR